MTSYSHFFQSFPFHPPRIHMCPRRRKTTGNPTAPATNREKLTQLKALNGQESKKMASAVAPKAIPKFRYLSAWFCPFAHRATLALVHHKGRVDYEWVEALGWELEKDEKSVTGTGKDWYYHWKAEELTRVNKSGLVPTLIAMNPETGETDESKVVWESLVAVDFIDHISGATGKDRLVPEDPYWAAKSRMWADKLNKDCCSPYYGVLVRKEDSERREFFQKLVAGLESFSEQLRETSGPTFLPDSQLSNADIALIPWAYRYYVFEHYRGPEYEIPKTPALEPYHEWFNHVMNLESVKATLPNKDRYLEHIAKYADGSARSKVANAVRRGVAAHDFEDDKDDYQK